MTNIPRYSIRVVNTFSWLQVQVGNIGPPPELRCERDHWGEWVKFADVEALLVALNEALISQRVIGHGEGQEHAIADVNAGRVDDLIAPRLLAARPAVKDGKCPTCGAFGIPESRRDKASTPRSAEEQRVWDALDEARQHVKPLVKRELDVTGESND